MINDTLKERDNRYGKFEDVANITQELCNVLKKAPSYDQLAAVHLEAYHIILQKIARSVCGDVNYSDNAHDIAGYALLLEEYSECEKQRLNLPFANTQKVKGG